MMPRRKTHVPLDPDQRRLAERWWNRARSFARSLCWRWGQEKLDPDGIAAESLCRAAQAHRLGDDRGFWSLLCRCIRCATVDAIVAQRALKRGSGWRRRPLDLVARAVPSGDEPVGAALEAFEAVEALSRRLPAPEGEAVRRMYLHCDSRGIRKLGQRLGVGDHQAHELLTRSYRELREQALAGRALR